MNNASLVHAQMKMRETKKNPTAEIKLEFILH